MGAPPPLKMNSMQLMPFISLSNARTNTSDDIEDNSTLMPVGGNSRFIDVNPVRVELDQVTVDNAIAQIVESEQNLATDNPDNTEGDTLTKGSPDQVAASSEITNEQEDTENLPTNTPDNAEDDIQTKGSLDQAAAPNKNINEQEDPNKDTYNTDTEVDESENEQPKKGYVKLMTHGIKKKSSLEGRSYRCTICGESKRSAHRLNDHHRKNHEAQMCGICGKIFELASSLTHHMYSHEERRYYCNKCSFHSHFESELKKHKITHHTTPQHQCMHSNCGRWFMRKADLVLHVETHKQNVIKCDICDHTTTLPKYMKEHMKSHGNVLPYKCDICNKRFLWRSGV